VEKPFSINTNKAESAVLKPLVIDKMRLPWEVDYDYR
jgi:hypothetical protein